MKPKESEFVCLARSHIQDALQYKTVSAVPRLFLENAIRELEKALDYEEDEPCRPSGDDD